MLRRLILIALATPLVAVGCFDVLNIGDIRVEDGTASGGGSAEGGNASMGGEGGSGGEASTSSGGAPATGGGGTGGTPVVGCNGLSTDVYVCADAAPEGWTGPYVAGVDVGDEECPSAAPNEVMAAGQGAINDPPASCSTCDCASPTGVSCSTPSLTVYDDPGCFDLNDFVQFPQVGSCVDFSSSRSAEGNDNSLPSGGTCAASGGTATLQPATFANVALVCASPPVADDPCGAAQCVPAGQAPFSTGPCIIADGERACPEGAYTEREVVYDIEDNRACSNCECESPTGTTCSAVSTLFSNPDCSGGTTMVQHDGNCVDFPGIGSGARRAAMVDVTPSGGSCATSGGEPIGTATEGDATTICCMP